MMRRDIIEKSAVPVTGFYCGDDVEARAAVGALIRHIGFAPVDAGPMYCARYLEAMAHLNIQIAVGMKGGMHANFAYLQTS